MTTLASVRSRMADLIKGRRERQNQKDTNHIDGYFRSSLDLLFDRMEDAARVVEHADSDWLQKKVARMEEEDLDNISGLLAEIRVYRDILICLPKAQIKALGEVEGPDFVISLTASEIWIEVSCPDINSSTYNWYTISKSDNFSHMIQAKRDPRNLHPGVAPRGLETHTGEIAKKIAGAKYPERKQISDDSFSILWLDFRDPTRWRRNLESDQAMPVIKGGNSITSGYLWYAAYARPDDPIFDNLRGGSRSEMSEADFAGRFELEDTKVDLIIACSGRAKIGLMNHKSRKVSYEAYTFIVNLPEFSQEFSWVAADRQQIAERVDKCHQKLWDFKKAFFEEEPLIRVNLIERLLKETWQ